MLDEWASHQDPHFKRVFYLETPPRAEGPGQDARGHLPRRGLLPRRRPYRPARRRPAPAPRRILQRTPGQLPLGHIHHEETPVHHVRPLGRGRGGPLVLERPPRPARGVPDRDGPPRRPAGHDQRHRDARARRGRGRRRPDRRRRSRASARTRATRASRSATAPRSTRARCWRSSTTRCSRPASTRPGPTWARPRPTCSSGRPS